VIEPTTQPAKTVLSASWLGRVDYPVAWAWQRRRHELRQQDLCGDTLALLEHPATYTLGRRSVEGELIYDAAQRAARGIVLYRVDRGGRATYHGPGQLVGYPIVGLGGRYDVLAYLRGIESALIETLAELGVAAERDPRHTGVWVGRNKVAAIGVKITRGVTMHGFALNLTTDLEMFKGIVPCGIQDAGVTSVVVETGKHWAGAEVALIVARHFGRVLDRQLRWDGHGMLELDGARPEPSRLAAQASR
jgi:lipoyl(octanoyl) transferase